MFKLNAWWCIIIHVGSMQNKAGRGFCWPSQSFIFCLLSPPLMEMQQHRLLSDLERRTLKCAAGHQGLAVPVEQFWYEAGVRTVWWDLDLLHQREIQEKLNHRSMSKWCVMFQERCGPDMPSGGLPYFIRQKCQANGHTHFRMVFIRILDDVCFLVINISFDLFTLNWFIHLVMNRILFRKIPTHTHQCPPANRLQVILPSCHFLCPAAHLSSYNPLIYITIYIFKGFAPCRRPLWHHFGITLGPVDVSLLAFWWPSGARMHSGGHLWVPR